MDMDQDEEKYPLVLARNVKEFTIEWWGTNQMNHAEWMTEWDDNQTNTIPQMVRVHLVLGANIVGGKTAPDFAATRIYTVPSQMMPVIVQRGGAGGPGGPRFASATGVPPGGNPGRSGRRVEIRTQNRRRRHENHCRRQERGFAVIIALVAVTVLTLMAGAFAYSMKIETKLAANTNDDEQFYWVGRGGVDRACWWLALEGNQPFSSKQQYWAGGPGDGPKPTACSRANPCPIFRSAKAPCRCP